VLSSLNPLFELETTRDREFTTYNTLPYYSSPPKYSSSELQPQNIFLCGREGSTHLSITQLRNYIGSYVYSIANTLSKGKVHYIDSYVDELYGVVVKVTTELAAREALELWLKIVEHLKLEKYDVVVAVEWLGEKNLDENELVDHIVKIMVKSGKGPKALSGFDSVNIVRKEREE